MTPETRKAGPNLPLNKAMLLEIENSALKRIIRDLISQARRSPVVVSIKSDNMTPIATTITKGQFLEAHYASKIKQPTCEDSEA